MREDLEWAELNKSLHIQGYSKLNCMQLIKIRKMNLKKKMQEPSG